MKLEYTDRNALQILGYDARKTVMISQQASTSNPATSHPATALENFHPLQHPRLHQRAHLLSTFAFFVALLEEIGHPLLLHTVAECL